MPILEHTMVEVHHQKRQHVRASVKIMADIRVSGGIRNKVRIVDLSRAGFQMECLAFIPDERPVFMTLPGFVQLECGIIWRSEWRYGCAFLSPLHEAVYGHIIKKYPMFQATEFFG